jgi:hypothetical protein
MVSERFVRQLVTDRSFFDSFPEFSSLKAAIPDTKGRTRGGCSRCGSGRKTGDRLLSGFITILRSLGSERVAALKRRVNAQQLQFNGFNQIRGAHEVMTL